MPSHDPVLVYREIAGDSPLFAAVTTVRETRRPHGHDFCEAFLVLEGELVHLVNGHEESLGAGSLRILGPDDAHGFASRGARLVNVAIPARFWRGFTSLVAAPEPTEDALPLLSAFDAALASHARGATIQDAAAFLLALTAPHRDREPGPPWLAAARAALNGDASLRAGLAAMRGAAGTSEEHLSRVHRAVHGSPPSAHLAERRLTRAAELLTTTDLPVAAVAATVGYASPSHFHRAFTARYALPPGAWRRSDRLFSP